MIKQLRSMDRSRVHVWLMLVLTFSTGVNDAVGYLGLNRVFTGNMTGNIVILGMALIGADHLPVIGPAVALGCFALGAVLAGRILKNERPGWSVRTSILFAVVGTLLAVAAGAVFANIVGDSENVRMMITGGLAAAMGVQAATARHLGLKDLTTVVVTSTLTGLAADSRFAGRTATHQLRRFAAIILILVGATVGASLVHVQLGLGVLLCALCTLGTAAVGELIREDAQANRPTADLTAP
jgi:uncharacterized membrane protein YoaK (UPF0700 family)